jgi:hypothetical protein
MASEDRHAATASEEALLVTARRSFHAALLSNQLQIAADGVASIADRGSRTSVAIAANLIRRLDAEAQGARLSGQEAGAKFEAQVETFLQNIMPQLAILRCGDFRVYRHSAITLFEQYEHLAAIEAVTKDYPELKVALGADYIIKPDVVVVRMPEPDSAINSKASIVDRTVANHSPIRSSNNVKPILHASVSCKWTLRSDRAQNARSEALNLIRNRKGRLPHTVVVTAEPTPGRIASIALGTGDLDCVYHIALQELRAAIEDLGYEDALDLLDTMIEGKRLRDISDLPLDLTV